MAQASKPHKVVRLAPTGALAALWTAAPAICGMLLLVRLGPIADWLLHHREAGIAIYVAVFILAAGVGLLPTYTQSILGGWVFGMWLGGTGALIGFTGGAALGYIIARRVSQNEVERMIERNQRAKAVRHALVGRSWLQTVLVVALIRLSPTSPFALSNLAMASAGVPLGSFVVGTTIGMAPRALLAVGLAAAAASTGARDIQTFAQEQGAWLLIAGIFVMVIVLAILGLVARKALQRFRQHSIITSSGTEESNAQRNR